MKFKAEFKSLLAAAIITAMPGLAVAATCKEYAAACAAKEEGTTLACMLQWYSTNGQKAFTSCKTLASRSNYSVCKDVNSACQVPGISVGPYNRHPDTGYYGDTVTAKYSVETFGCSEGHFLESMNVRYGPVSTFTGARIGAMMFRCSSSVHYTQRIANQLKYGDAMLCNTGQFFSGMAIHSDYSGRYVKSITARCTDAARNVTTTKTFPRLGAALNSNDRYNQAYCTAGTFVSSVSLRVYNDGNDKNKYLLGIQVTCSRPA